MTIAITVNQMAQATPEQRDAWNAWATANGLDPTKISSAHAVIVVADRIQYHEFYVNEAGHRVVDLTGPEDQMATLFREAPLLVPMPEAWPEG